MFLLLINRQRKERNVNNPSLLTASSVSKQFTKSKGEPFEIPIKRLSTANQQILLKYLNKM